MDNKEYSVLKIYSSTTDKHRGKLLYEHIVNSAKEFGISGVTVYRGVMGFGMSSKEISSSKFWELTEKLPVMIEMIDHTILLEEFFKRLEPELLEMDKGCLVIIESVELKLLKPGKNKKV